MVCRTGRQRPSLLCCNHPAVKRNNTGSGARCCVHGRNWFPKKESRLNRGYLCLGPQFLRPHSGSKNVSMKFCCCDNTWCNAVGYSRHCVPIAKSPDLRLKVAHAIATTKETRDKILNPTNRVFVAPWHFLPEHRRVDDDGHWKVVEVPSGKVFKDYAGKEWLGLPPPVHSPKYFAEQEAQPMSKRRMLAQDRWRAPASRFPRWVGQYLKVEGMKTERGEATTNVEPCST